MTARTWRVVAGAVVAVVLALVAPQVVGEVSGGGGSTSSSRATPSDEPTCYVDTSGIPGRTGLDVVAVADLPPEAAEVLDAIDAGGPYVSPRDDGGVFGNREGLLPQQSSGWYREYTVPTPGEDDRGARRIVTGGDPVVTWYWTDDHYDSFSIIARCP